MDAKTQEILKNGISEFQIWKDSFGEFTPDESLSIPSSKVESLFSELVQHLGGNYPFHHPVYAGQMLKPPHPVAWAAYSLAMTINPNNHALDGGPPSSEMEKEVVANLADFFG
ncbi:MAG: aspartate aminotransferase family protein, partial [Balneolales bacterium]|nr:aspartate aminotransferase family protein [Balneolales bacterium]